jgi:hypothetical protein
MKVGSRLVILLLFGSVLLPTFAVVGQPYQIENVSDRFIPSGWMGDYNDLSINTYSADDPYSKPYCTEILYTAARSNNAGWAGIYWQHPENNWGTTAGWIDVFNGARKLTFWARGKNGGEKAEFKMGGIAGEYSDSVRPAISTGPVVLSNNWTRYEINLTRLDLSQVIGGFCWVTNAESNPRGSTIYLDDISYEWGD